jgi:hypothetical protein
MTYRKRENIHSGKGYVMIAPIILGPSLAMVGDGAIANLFVIATAVGVFLSTIAYLWHEIKYIYPKDLVKKKRIYLVVSSLVCLAFSPLVFLTLIIVQFSFLFKEVTRKENKRLFDVIKGERGALYLVSIVSVFVAVGVFIYAVHDSQGL